MKKIMFMLALLATSFAVQAQSKFHDAEAQGGLRKSKVYHCKCHGPEPGINIFRRR